MVNYFIYANDFSGSTDGVKHYHVNGLKALKQFKRHVQQIKSELPDSDDPRIIYLHWGHKCEEVTEEKIIENHKLQFASGCDTLPETIIGWIKDNIDKNNIKLLYIITDGLIDSNSVSRCLELNENLHYENVVFHGFHKNLNEIDLSVASSFLKAHCTIYRNNKLLDSVNVSETFDYDKITIDNFATEKETLKSYIKLKYLNNSFKHNAASLNEIEELKKLKVRLLTNISKRTTGVPNILANLNTTDKTTFISEFKTTRWYINLTDPSYSLNIDIDKSISTLINYIVTEEKSYEFDALKFETKFSEEVAEEPIVDVDLAPDQQIEFPDIILDDEKGVPVIILYTGTDLLKNLIFRRVRTAAFSKFMSKMECPLFLLNNSDLNNSIGYFYTLDVYKQLINKTNKKEPRTRRAYHGGLVLVDTDDFDKYNDYILSATYFNGKKVKYNVGLFYFVLWKICTRKKWMDKNVVEHFKKYMLRRISTTVCKIGLSSLPLDPHINVSLSTALWYCVEMSSYIFKDDPNHFTHERLRLFWGIAHYMIEILKYLQFDLDFEYIDKRKELIKHVMHLKKIPNRWSKVSYLAEKIFKKDNGFLVSEIENPANVNILNCLKFNHNEILNDDIMKEEVNLNDYFHFLHSTDDSKILISNKTFRPYFMIDQTKSYYSNLYNLSKEIVITKEEGQIKLNYKNIENLEFSKILPFYNLFFQYCKSCDAFPTLQEYEKYILKKKGHKGNFVTIFPVNVNKRIGEVFLTYEKVIMDKKVDKFVGTCGKYVKRVERIKGEKVTKFENDTEICKFISNEECKCNLKKLAT